MHVLIIGCGYVGAALGTELTRLGHEVFGVTRTAEGDDALKSCGIHPFRGDVTQRATLDSLPGPFDWIVNTVSSSKGGLAEYKQAYLEGTRNLLDWLAAAPPKKFVYTSSTSVYGQTDGSQVKESSPTEPASETSQVLVAAEKLLTDAAREKKFPAVILRVAGIYGPERGHLFLQYLKDEAKIAGRGERLINMIHRDDLVNCIVAALKSGRPGEIYNAVDDEPVPQIHFFRWLSETLGKSMPPFVPEAEASKRGATQKKVLNRKLRMELGCPLRYPTYRQGYTAEIQRLQDAGLL
ncbi:MAG TPA: SDR family oxidoreductase [Candidatus Saccharimonadales bacterium]|nr:SDR family oxidoreductase [Candidatus Saccharimonadales bacterium]